MTRKDTFFRFIAAAGFVACISLAPISFAKAQDVPAPDDAQLKNPAAATPTAPGAQATTTTTTTTTTAAAGTPTPNDASAQANAMPAQPDAVKNNAPHNADPCPAPTAAISAAPDDLAKVQADIDRFGLCVQRAQLLERFNESFSRNAEANDAALGLKAPGLAGAQRAGGSGGLPPLPANALAGADVTPLPAAPVKAPSGKQAAAVADSAPTETAAATPAQPAEPAAPWTIREIYGSGTGVEAKLVSPEGDEVRAKSGMKLPDGKTTVVRVTPSGVTIKDAKGVKPLDWAKI